MRGATATGEKSLVTIVTPVYNGEPYLAECIESVLAQTHDAWRMVIVDNRSEDGTRRIADRYAKSDGRIQVVANETFVGQVDNINRAMSQTREDSAYTKPLLADDWMFPRCLEEMVAVADRFPSVAIVSSYRLDDRLVTCDGLPYPSTTLPGPEVCRTSLLDGIFVFGSPSTLLFRADVVRGRRPFYDASLFKEDTEACYEILRDHDFGFAHQVLTFTRRQNDSATAAHRVHDPAYLLDRMVVTLRHGPHYLSGTEFAACLERVEAEYYRFLAERSVSGVDAAFWEYHRSGLATAGCAIQQARLRRSMAGVLRDRAVRPSHLFRDLNSRRRRRIGTSARPA